MATFLRLIRKVSSHKELSAAVVLRTALLAMLAPGATLTRVSTLLARQSLERPPLTPLGSAIRSVLMVSMGSGYCNTGRSDWRGELPRYLAHFLPKARTYVTTGRNRLSSTCRPCLADIAQSGENHTFDCTGFLKQRPDLVLVFGSGNVYEPDSQCDPEGGNWTACAQAHYPSLRLLKNARLLGGSQSNQRPISVHFPVRKLEELHRNPFRCVRRSFRYLLPQIILLPCD